MCDGQMELPSGTDIFVTFPVRALGPGSEWPTSEGSGAWQQPGASQNYCLMGKPGTFVCPGHKLTVAL